MKWLIVEDALRDRKGHWLEYVSTFVRGFTALGDEVVVLCDRKAQGFVIEQTRARPVLPESIWHRMGDGAGALKRYLRVPLHAMATFFAIRKFLKEFNHNRARGQVRERATGGWPEGRGSGNERVKGHIGFYDGGTDNTEMEAGQSLLSQAGAAFSNPSASELARDSENTSPIRSANELRVCGEQSDRNPVNFVNPVKNCFGFRLRAYEAWWDLRKFFPDGEDELKDEILGIWKRNYFSGFRFEVSGFVLRKWRGLMNRIFGHRVKGCFRPGKFTSCEATLFDTR